MNNNERPLPPHARRPVRPVRPSRPDRGPIPQAIFIAPAFRQGVGADDHEVEPRAGRASRNDGNGLRMTRSATEAARRAGLDDEAIRRVMSEPTQVAPDRDHPDRTRFTRGPVVVVTAKDGVVLGVYTR
jgi:hypothetical protein